MFKKIIIYILLIISFIYSYISINNKNIIYSNENSIDGYITYYYKNENKTIFYLKSDELVLCTFEGNIDIKLGDYVSVSGSLSVANTNTIFNMFNYKEYLETLNIYHIFNVDNYYKIKDNNKISYLIKNKIINKIDNISNNSYLYAFILGNTKYILDDALESYRINGISHLFAISGMHVSLFTLLILKLFNKFKYKEVIVFFFLIFYMFLTDYSPSVIRCSILFILITFNKKLKLNISMNDLMILLLSICIFIDPYIIYKIGFLYSYIITFSLIYFNKIISRYNSYIIKSLMTSIISFLVSMPITINNFYQINILGIFLNLIFIPLVSFIIFPFALITFIFPNNLFGIFTNALERLSIFFSNIDIFVIHLSKMSYVLIIIYYIVIFIVLKMIEKKKYKYITILLLVVTIHKNINYIRPYLDVIYFDVKEADASLIMMPYGNYNILIDTGRKDEYLNIVKYLKSRGITNISYIIITHGDADHIGNAINIINNINVSNVVFNCGEYSDLELELINELKIHNIKYYYCINEINLNEYKLKFLNTSIYDNENNNSSVVYFYYDNYKFLFMGDAGVEKENEILNKYNLSNIDFLKVGHHGSDTSSSKKFIESINPKYSIISVGNNKYGHPKDSVLKILENNKSIIYRTDEDGSIEIKIKSDGYSIETCKP